MEGVSGMYTVDGISECKICLKRELVSELARKRSKRGSERVSE